MPGKHVSQATFDAIVREAMDDFGLSEVEALADAKEQLRASGVTDFSGLVTSIPTSGETEHAGVRFANDLRSAGNPNGSASVLKMFIDAHITTKVIGIAGAHGAVEILCNLLNQSVTASLDSELYGLLQPVCEVIARLCCQSEINRMRFVRCTDVDGIEALRCALRSTLTELLSVEKDDADAKEICISAYVCAASVLRAVRAVQRCSESIKTKISGDGMLDVLCATMDCSLRCLRRVVDADACSDGRAEKLGEIICGVCSVVRQILSADDNTVAVSETFNRARVITGEASVMASGLKPLTYPRTFPRIALDVIDCCANVKFGLWDTMVIGECLNATRLCAVSDEICKKVVDMGFATVGATMLRSRGKSFVVARAAVALLRNLAARDQCKSELAKLVHDVTQTVREHAGADRLLVEHFCGYVASLCLRRPDISKSFANAGVIDEVVHGMEQFREEYSLLKVACLAIRNSSSRDEEARERVRSIANLEVLVRHAQTTFPGECDAVAYSALWGLNMIADSEIRRDERYKMPDGMFSSKVVR